MFFCFVFFFFKCLCFTTTFLLFQEHRETRKHFQGEWGYSKCHELGVHSVFFGETC